MAYDDLREFIRALEKNKELKSISAEVDPILEITEFADRSVKTGGPALLFEHPKGSGVPVLINAFASMRRMEIVNLKVYDIDRERGTDSAQDPFLAIHPICGCRLTGYSGISCPLQRLDRHALDAQKAKSATRIVLTTQIVLTAAEARYRSLARILGNVRAAVSKWRRMQHRQAIF